MERLLIKNAKIITREGVLTGKSVLVADGIIEAVIPETDETGVCYEIDAAGCYLSPGFIDLHTHGRQTADAMDGTRESLSGISKDLLRHGVTGFLITTQAAPTEKILSVIRTAVEYIKKPEPDGSAPLGIYVESPYLSPAKKGAQVLTGSGEIKLDEIKAILDAGEGYIRVFTLAPELNNAAEAVRLIADRGAVPAAAHTDSGYDAAMTAINAGLKLATHTFNAMRPINHKEPGVVGACLTDRRVVCEAIADGHHLHPSIVRLIYAAKGPDGMALVSDSVAAAGIPDGQYEFDGRRFIIKDGAVRLEDGTLAGSMLSLDAAVGNAIKFTGCQINEAIKMASLTPARVIGIAGKKGSIEVGKDADLIIFDEKIGVKSAITGSRYIPFE